MKLTDSERINDQDVMVQLCCILAYEYENIFIVQVSDDSYVRYCPDRKNHTLIQRDGGDDFYARLRSLCVTYIAPENRERLLQLFSKEHLIESMRLAAPVTARIQIGSNDKQIQYDIKAFPCAEQNVIVVGIQRATTQIEQVQVNTQRSVYRSIVDTISKFCEAIYYVDIATGEYTEYHSSENYAKMKISKQGSDFFKDTQFHLKTDIFAEDYPKMREAMKPENLFTSIRENGFIILNYRLLFDGVPRYVMLYAAFPPDDPEHMIVVVADVDADMQRTLAYEKAIVSAIQLANLDALTGLKNKNAYAQKEHDLNLLMQSQQMPAFAVVVCDINGLKQINDTKGHIAGDAYIQQAAQMICTVFTHSPVYRIGGDEFAVLLEGRDYQNREALMQELNAIVQDNRIQQLVTVASGISVLNPAADRCVQDVFARADQEMYAQKRHTRG